MKTRIRVESYLKALPDIMSHTYYPEYKEWFFWCSMQLTEVTKSGVYQSGVKCYTLEDAQKTVDAFLKNNEKPLFTNSYIDYP